MKDRLIAGFVSGAIAALIQEVVSLLFKAFGWTDRAISDYAGVLIMYRSFPGLLAFLVSFLAHLIFGGILGYLFALIVKKTLSQYLVLKGIMWGCFLWFTTLGAGTLFRLPLFTKVPPLPALMTLFSALIFSLSNVYILHYLEKRTNLV